jgi:hypothetical protein
MKRNPSEKRILERMAPGVLSRDGFLGSDARSLGDIIADDAAVLDAAGLSRKAVAAVLQEIFQQAEAGLETTVSFADGQIQAELLEVMGRMPCPFACGTRGRKGVLSIRFGETSLRITPLSVHLIAEHGFFGGRGNPYRLEPADAVALCRRFDRR